MPMMDTRGWRREGYIPASDAARSIGLSAMALHRAMNKGKIVFKTQGRYRFVLLTSTIEWVREHFTDETIAAKHIEALREAVKLRNDVGTKRRSKA